VERKDPAPKNYKNVTFQKIQKVEKKVENVEKLLFLNFQKLETS